MRISACNVGLYKNYKYSFKSNNAPLKSMGVEDKLPNPRLYADVDNYNVPYDDREVLLSDYVSKINSICYGKDGKLDSRIVDYLDNAKFEFKTTDGSSQMMTIGDVLKSSVREVYKRKGTLYHATSSISTAESIIQNGFDPMKIARTKLGPGFYFTTSEGHSLQYSRSVLKCECEGNCAYVKPEFYEKITKSGATHGLTQFIGLDTSTYSLGHAAYDAAKTMLNEYSRNYLVNNLNVDMAEGLSSLNESSIAVYNPNILSNIRLK